MTDDIEIQKRGYLKLVDLCVGNSTKRDLIHFINNLKNHNGDENFVTTLNYVMNHLDQNGIHFIMALDWKQAVKDLVWRIKSSLQHNFNLTIALPDPITYGARASVSFPNVFKDFDNSLRIQNFQIGFIDTDADEYVIIVHRISDEPEIVEGVKQIGYRYLDAASPKINNVN
jgi:hypothetical protein